LSGVRKLYMIISDDRYRHSACLSQWGGIHAPGAQGQHSLTRSKAHHSTHQHHSPSLSSSHHIPSRTWLSAQPRGLPANPQFHWQTSALYQPCVDQALALTPGSLPCRRYSADAHPSRRVNNLLWMMISKSVNTRTASTSTPKRCWKRKTESSNLPRCVLWTVLKFMTCVLIALSVALSEFLACVVQTVPKLLTLQLWVDATSLAGSLPNRAREKKLT